jgi:hypothetical protein
MAAWDRLEGESAKLYARFERFRAMGPGRTLEAFYRAETGRKTAAPGQWRADAEKWRWKERAEAWDAEQTVKARAAEEEAIEQRRKAWIAQAQAVQSVGGQALLKLQDALNDPDAANISPRDILSFLTEGTKLELLARGEATDKIEHSGSITVEQRRARLVGILDRIRDRVGTGRN